MIRMFALFACAALFLPGMAQAQSSYDAGYRAGYNDGPAPSPTMGMGYAAGFQGGQEDGDDEVMEELDRHRADDARHQAEMDAIGKENP